MPDSEDGRVNLAVLSTKLDNIERLIRTHIENDSIQRKDHEGRLRTLEANSIKYEQRLNLQTGILGTLTVLGSSIAAWLGVRY